MGSREAEQAREGNRSMSGMVKAVDKGTSSLMLVGDGPLMLDSKNIERDIEGLGRTNT